ncbi:MAG: tetratricopeptide repeat protein, partial [bacterium]|nr:tetratricopeptide repeat protein [bacterium]
FAELLGTVGFLGLLIYLGTIGLFLLISWLLISKDFAGLPLIATFTALVISQLVYYQNTSLAFVFWLTLGLSAVSWRAVSPALTPEKKISFKNFPESALIFLTLAIVFGVAILAFYFYGARYYLADANYFKALSVSGEQRIKILQRAVSQNPNSSNYRQALARSYLAEALGEMQKPQAEQDTSRIKSLVSLSIDQGRIATVLAPNQVSGWETLGVIYREIGGVAQGAMEWGIKSFEKAIGLEPTNPVLHTELGKLYLVAGDNKKAKDNFNKALEKKSDYAAAVIQLALLLERDNATDEAIVNLENLINKNPLEVEARFQLGRIYFNNNRIDEAIAQFNSVTLLSPNHSNAHYSLGVAYAAQKKTSLAIQEFEKVLELNPDNSDIIKKLKSLRGY